jgi:hypothetical protein
MKVRADKLWRTLDRFRSGAVGWTQHQWYERGRGRQPAKRCLAGELLTVTAANFQDMDRVNRDPECQLVRDIILEQFPDRTRDAFCTCTECKRKKGNLSPAAIIPRFNDHPDTTFEDVLLVLEKAAIKCDEVLGS